MRQITTVRAMQRWALEQKRAGARIGFVPTMGYLHDGHMSLVRRARKAAGRDGKVVVSIYVNPTQFAPTEDLAQYPRDLKRDKEMCAAEGVDIVFTPSDAEMYPGRAEGLFSCYVVEEGLSKLMEGASRPTHFRGVTTIVAKLFNIVLPDVSVFGAKDFQQAAIIQRMVKNLDFPVKIIVAPTVRERDGLAMSSRNKYLNPPQRAEATIVSQAIKQARELVSRKTYKAEELLKELEKLIKSKPEARLDYIEFFDPETLLPATKVGKGTHMALAVFFGKTRLIDNGLL